MPTTIHLWVRSDHLPLLKGDQTQLLPFTEGLFPPGAVYRLWELAQENQALPYIFWTDQATEPQARGSLSYFLKFFEDKPVFVAVRQDPAEILGMVWFANVIRYRKGDIGIWLRRKTAPALAQEIGALAVEWAFRACGWEAVYALTPWRHARDLCLAVGAELVATVPGYHYERERARPVYVLRARQAEGAGDG